MKPPSSNILLFKDITVNVLKIFQCFLTTVKNLYICNSIARKSGGAPDDIPQISELIKNTQCISTG